MKTLKTFVLLSLLAAGARGDDWTQQGRDEQRTRGPAETLSSPTLHGARVTGSPTVASAVVADGFLITAGLDGVVRGWRESDRAALWISDLGSPIIATPAIRLGRVFVAATGGVVHVLRLVDGATLGQIPTGGADRSSPLESSGRLLLGSGFPNTSLLSIDPATNAVAWSAELDQVTESSPVVAAGKAIILSNSGTLSAFDLASGAPAWSTSVDGVAGTASPLVVGAAVYVLGGATLSRVDLDPANWGSNASLSFVDPLPPPANAQDLDWAGSSLALAGGALAGIVRFDYPQDQDGDGYLDNWTLREYAFLVDPVSLAILWQVPLGVTTVPDQNGIPAYRLVPSPVSIGASLAVASSVEASLRLLSTSDGSVQGSFGLDGPCQASPFVANARVYALTKAGTLHAFEGATPQPAAAAALSPSGGNLSATPGTLSWSASTPGATFRVRLARDGELLMDWDHEFSGSATSIACPALDDGFTYHWGVRVQDPSGAWGPWTWTSFGQNVPPDAPGSLSATPGHGKVALGWTPSPTPGVSGYRLSYGPTGSAPTTTLTLGAVTSTLVSGLPNGVSVTFELRAIGPTGVLSSPSIAAATPSSKIRIGPRGYDSLAAAAAAASPGQTIRLGADLFVIDAGIRLRDGVGLSGENALATRIAASGRFTMIQAGKGSTLQGVSLSGGSIGVDLESGTVANCVIRDMSEAGIEAGPRAMILNNTIVENAGAAVRAHGGAEARNNILQDNGDGLQGPIRATYNSREPVLFLDPAAGDYREREAQPSLDAGDPGDEFTNEPDNNGLRINQGAFGNTPLAARSTPRDGGGSGCSASTRPSAFGAWFLGAGLAALLLALRRR